MENIKLAVITKDKDYGRALGLALVEVYKSFTVTLFQSVPIHSKLEEFDLVLKDFEKEDSEPFIYLVEKPSMTEKNYEDKRFRLYKYSAYRTKGCSCKESEYQNHCFLLSRRRCRMYFSSHGICQRAETFQAQKNYLYQYGGTGLYLGIYGTLSGREKHK